MPLLGMLGSVHLVYLAVDPAGIHRRKRLSSHSTEASRWMPGLAAILIVLVVFIGWLIYRVLDWSNDKFIVNAEQIIDVDRKPFGTETRNAAQLENILGTEYRRIGILGNIFNLWNGVYHGRRHQTCL